MPGLHAEGSSTGRIYTCRITAYDLIKYEIGIVRITYVPLGLGSAYDIQVNMLHGLAHKLAAAAGYNRIAFAALTCIHVHKLSAAVCRSRAYTYAVRFIAIRAQESLVSHIIKYFERIVECGLIRLGAARK